MKSKRKNCPYENFTDDELTLAVEFMVSPQDLTIREIAANLLASLDFTEEEVREHIQKRIYLNNGARLGLLQGKNCF